MADEITFDDVCRPSQFVEEFPHLFNQSGCPKMEYLIRTRHLNGLTDCGAIVEPVHRRPMFVKTNFLLWLLSIKTAA